MEPMLRGLALERCAEGIGNDKAGVLRENFARHVERGGEKQPVAVQPIVDPFLIGTKIGNRRLDLHDPQFPVAPECHQVGAPT